MWTMVSIEQAVQAINVPSIRGAIDAVVGRNGSPAYDILGYFNDLDSAEELTDAEKNKLDGLQKKHEDEFIRRVLSIRTQYYMNTHHSRTRVEQSICSVLGIKYTPRRAISPG